MNTTHHTRNTPGDSISLGATRIPSMQVTSDRLGMNDRDPDRIERKIESQRENIDHLVDEISTRLSPSYMVERVVDMGRENSQRMIGRVTGAVRDNPLPAAAAVASLIWLYRSSRPRHEEAILITREKPQTASLRERVDDLREAATDTIGSARDRASDTTREMRDRVDERIRQARDNAGRVSDRASATLHSASDSARNAARDVAERSRQATRKTRSMYDDHPLVGGIAAVALGSIIAAALPRTRREDEVMGATSDTMMERAKTKAQEPLEKGKSMAKEAISKATDKLDAANKDATETNQNQKNKENTTKTVDTSEYTSH